MSRIKKRYSPLVGIAIAGLIAIGSISPAMAAEEAPDETSVVTEDTSVDATSTDVQSDETIVVETSEVEEPTEQQPDTDQSAPVVAPVVEEVVVQEESETTAPAEEEAPNSDTVGTDTTTNTETDNGADPVEEEQPLPDDGVETTPPPDSEEEEVVESSFSTALANVSCVAVDGGFIVNSDFTHTANGFPDFRQTETVLSVTGPNGYSYGFTAYIPASSSGVALPFGTPPTDASKLVQGDYTVSVSGVIISDAGKTYSDSDSVTVECGEVEQPSYAQVKVTSQQDSCLDGKSFYEVQLDVSYTGKPVPVRLAVKVGDDYLGDGVITVAHPGPVTFRGEVAPGDYWMVITQDSEKLAKEKVTVDKCAVVVPPTEPKPEEPKPEEPKPEEPKPQPEPEQPQPEEPKPQPEQPAQPEQPVQPQPAQPVAAQPGHNTVRPGATGDTVEAGQSSPIGLFAVGGGLIAALLIARRHLLKNGD